MRRIAGWMALAAATRAAAALASEDAFASDMASLHRLRDARSRSISLENFAGAKGAGGMATTGTGSRAARELGRGWKVSPSVRIAAGETFTLAEIEGPGAIQQIWMTPAPIDRTRHSILRFYWDDEVDPSVEVPLGDFFACGWGQFCQISSLAVCVNPGSAFNCYWTMPFRRRARVTLENRDRKPMTLYYQINYALAHVPDDAAYFHAQFRRANPLPEKAVYTIVDGIRGRGHYVGTYMAWEARSPGWWGEGEIQFYMDGDDEWPTICGTGTEDYFCGSYNFENRATKLYQPYTTPCAGLAQVIPAHTAYVPPQRFGLYRWHITDPVRFEKDLRVTLQALGWQSDRRYLPLQDDIASVAFWYQTEPHAKFPPLPDANALEVAPLPAPSSPPQ